MNNKCFEKSAYDPDRILMLRLNFKLSPLTTFSLWLTFLKTIIVLDVFQNNQ